jgi:hypothetical protein
LEAFRPLPKAEALEGSKDVVIDTEKSDRIFVKEGSGVQPTRRYFDVISTDEGMQID